MCIFKLNEYFCAMNFCFIFVFKNFASMLVYLWYDATIVQDLKINLDTISENIELEILIEVLAKYSHFSKFK